MLWWTYQQLRMGRAESRLEVVEKLAAGDDNSVGPLIFALKDKDTAVRCAAAKALVRFRDRRAVETLIQMLRDPAPLARAAAAESLGQIGDPAALNPLVGFLRDSDPIVRSIAARSLDRLGWIPGSNSHRVLQILATGNLDQLIELGPEGVAPLLDLLRNGPPNKQLAALKALNQIGDPRVVPAMLEALRKQNRALRLAALEMLEQLEDPASYPDIEKVLNDPDPVVREAALDAAAHCGGTSAVPALIRCLKDRSWEIRRTAAKKLGLLADRSAVEELCHLITDPDRDVRESAIAALGQLRDRRAIPQLVLGLLDKESSVRAAVGSILTQMDRHWEKEESIRRYLPKIISALKHPDYWVRHSATKLLERLKVDPNQPLEEVFADATTPAVPEKPVDKAPPHPAMSVLADLLFDRDRDLRLAAATALGRLREKGSGSILAAAMRDVDFSVREAAQSALAAMN